MGFEIGEVVGRVYSLEARAEARAGEDGTLEASSASSASSTTGDDRGGGKRLKLKTVLDDVTCTNGMGWTRDGKIM
jgi:sugar lactone lactonase YvrE